MAKAPDKDKAETETSGDAPVEGETAAERAARLRAELDTADAEAAAESGDMRATVSREMPRFLVKAMPNAHIVHEGVSYIGADYLNIHDVESDPDASFVLDGPTAMALAMSGQVQILSQEEAA